MARKILIVFAVLIVLLFGAALIVPIVFKDKIVAKVKTEINKNVNAQVDFGDFSISVFRSFPDLSLNVQDFIIRGIDDFESDTLAAINNTYLNLDIMSVIRGETIKIKSVILDQPNLHFIVLENGKANWDVIKAGDDAEPADDGEPMQLTLKKYQINNGNIIFDDRSTKFFISLFDLNHSGNGDFTEDIFTLSTKTNSPEVTMIFDKIPYLNKVNLNWNADLEMNLPASKYTFRENELTINDLVLAFDGFVAMAGDDIQTELNYAAKRGDFKSIISLIPAVYRKDFKDLQSSGNIVFNGYVKGVYNEQTVPAFALNVKVDNGMFKYPDLPNDLRDLNMDLKITKAQGDLDNMVIDMPRLDFVMGGDPFNARLNMRTPVSDPNIDASAKGKLDLAGVSKMVQLEEGTNMSGIINADVVMKGRMSAIEQKRFNEFNASGQISVHELNYSDRENPIPLYLKSMLMKFNPSVVTLENINGRYGRTDFRGNGSLENFLAYALKDEMLKGSLVINSSVVDLNEFMSSEQATGEQAQTQTSTQGVIEVPGNINFRLTGSAGKVIYEDWDISNVKGVILLADQRVTLSDVSMNTLDGVVRLSGYYDTKDKRQPAISYNVSADNLDIQKTYSTFVAVQKLAPIAQRVNGNFSTILNVAGFLDNNMEPVISSLNGKGNLRTSTVVVRNFEPLTKLADNLKMDNLKALDVNNINITFNFLDGRVFVEPFDIRLGEIASTVQGSNGFDQTMDYVMTMAIPRARLGGAANNVINNLVSKASTAGANINVGEVVNVDALLRGTIQDPQISLSLQNVAGSVVSDIKAQAQEELERRKKELEDQARAEADKLRTEAEAKAQAEADRLKKEAEDRARSEADRLKKEAEDKLKKDAGDKLKDVFGRPK
jgi:osmotically-inducible protein OsmY